MNSCEAESSKRSILKNRFIFNNQCWIRNEKLREFDTIPYNRDNLKVVGCPDAVCEE
jgi:hypothetical protein